MNSWIWQLFEDVNSNCPSYQNILLQDEFRKDVKNNYDPFYNYNYIILKLFRFRSTLIPDSPGVLGAGEELPGEHMVSDSETQPCNIQV